MRATRFPRILHAGKVRQKPIGCINGLTADLACSFVLLETAQRRLAKQHDTSAAGISVPAASSLSQNARGGRLYTCSTVASLTVAGKERDRVNIRQLFERHYASLVWYLHARLGDRDLAEDLAQEAFVRLIDKSPRAPDAWLYVVAGNLARDAQRGNRRRSRHLAIVSSLHSGPAEPVDPAPRADAAMCSAEESALVRETLALLPERDAALLVMRSHDVSYREIAAAIGIAPTSVGPLLARAQQRFIRALGKRAHDRGHDARASI